MFRKKWHEVLFTVVTSGLMIYLMGVYNVALHSGGLSYAVFGRAARSFPLEWLVGFVLAVAVASPLAGKLAFRVAQPGDRPVFIILCIQTFTVCVMVPLMSMVGTLESSGLTAALPLVWVQTAALNFLAAYVLQIFLVGPFVRMIFRHACGAFQPPQRQGDFCTTKPENV